MPVTFSYSKVVREVQKSDGSSFSPFRVGWSVRNVTTGKTALYDSGGGSIVAAKGEVSNAVRATALANANSAADTALTSATTLQREGVAGYEYPIGQPGPDTL
jgi:hypothetical protein